MKKGKKMLGFVMSLVLLLNLITINVQASTESNENFKATAIGNVNIISTTNITVGQAQDWARSKGATEEFIGLAPLYEKYSQSRGGVNWAVAYVQAAKETGYGRFGGVLDSSYHNPCGLKNSAGGEDDDPNAHKKFDNWEQGVIAHLDHLALYAGADGYPKTEYVTSWTSQPLADNQTYDPRHLGWYSTAVYGKCKTVNELGGNWAPSSTYGVELFRLYCDLTKSDYLEARSNLETPINNATINENSINIVGWALHAFGVKEVNVSIDNVSIGKITEFSTRNDVSAAYPGYFNGNQSGFNKTMDISSIQDGTRTLLVEIVANNGSVQEISRTIKIARANDPVVESLPTVGRIDEPADGAAVTSKTMTVRGWALAGSGVKEVRVLVDGKLKATTNTGLSRPDIGNAYPKYSNASSAGFQVNIDISDIANGTKTIAAEVVGNDGSVHKLTRNIKVNIASNTLATVGRIDEPADGATVTSKTMTVRGWALAGSGVKEVRVLVDGKLKATTNTGLSRPDIGNAYPKYSNASNAGFQVNVDISDIANGTKTITAEVVGNDGSVHKLTRNIKVNIASNTLATVGRIDEPADGATVTSKTMTVRGWALAGSGVKEVRVLVDGKLKATTNTGLSRPDIGNAYPKYSNASSAGFQVNVDISDIANGTKTITAEVVGNDGSVHKLTRNIKVNIASNTLATVGRIDEPADGAAVTSKTMTVRGWALAGSGVKEVRVLVDGKLKATTNTGLSRPDIGNAYPKYSNASNAGFQVNVDISDIANGTKTITAEVVGNDGSVHKLTRNIKVNIASNTLATVGRIDEPADGATVTSKTMTVRGWALAGSGVKEVRVLVDGKLKATTNTGLSRPDIGNAYPKYSNASSAGFQVNVDISDIANGTKTITAEVVGNDGSVHKLTRNIKVNIASNTLATVGRIDEPADGAAVTSKTMTVRGWALAGSGVKEVRVLVDGKLKATTNTGLSRPDIGNAYPKYSNASNAGFQVNVDISDIANGTKTITAEVVGNDGSVHKLTRNIKVNVPVITNSTTLGRIDEPVANENHYKSTIKVRGWAINESGISEVRVYVNGTDKGKITYGTSRPDVNAAYPGYPSGNNSGYESTINISDIAEGKVEIKVVVTAKDGTVKDFVTNINLKGKSQKLVVIDPGHENPGGDPGSTATHNGITYIESNLNLQIAVRLKNELESRGIAVVMTRSEGSGQIGPNASESLRNRVKLANDLNADFFISLHHNSGPASAQGFEVWYSIQSPTTRSVIFEDSKSLSIGREIALSNLDYKISKSRELAEEFTKTVSSSLGIVNRGAKYEPIGVPDYYVTKNTNMPSVIVENGFLTNANEAKKVSERTYQQKLAEILANIISNKL